MNFSIIIPAHNEEDSLKRTISSLENTLSATEALASAADLMVGDYDFEIVIVNDHSTDKTVSTVQELMKKYSNIKLLHNLGRRGFASTLIAGFRQAKGEFLVPLMADGCDDPDTVRKMYKKTEEGYDLICASRYTKGGKRIGGPKPKGFFSEFVGKSLHFFIRIPTTDIANAFKLYRRSTLEKIKIGNSDFAISMEIALKMYYQGFRIAEVPTCWKGRKQGKSKFQILKIAPIYLKWYLWALYKYLIRKKEPVLFVPYSEKHNG